MNSHWTELELGDFIELKRGYDLPKSKRVPGKFEIISSAGVTDYHNESKVKGPGVITGRYGTIGEVFYTEDDYWPLNTTLYVKDFKGNDPLFVYYLLHTINYLEYSDKAAVPGVNRNHLHKAVIKIPSDVASQKSIAQYLKMLDRKIALNCRLNESLEQIAQAIFKSWFVDFEPTKAKIAAREALMAEKPDATLDQIAITEQQAAIQSIASAGEVIPTEQLQAIAELFPNQFVDSELGEIPYGWEIKALDQIANYQNGLALQKFRPESGEDFLPVLKIAQLKAGFADGKEVAKASIKKECIVDNGDVIFSWSGSLVVDIWCGGRVALNQHLFKVTSNTYPKWFFYKWTKYHLEKFQQIAADKAVTMGHIKRSHLSEAKCLIPASELIKNKFISSLIDKQVQVRLESKVLSDVRDSLLPRLLTGEFSLAKVDSEHE